RDRSGKIVRVLYGEAKCTADHDTEMISDAYKKAGESPIVDFLRIIDVLREKNDPSSEQWIDAIRRARGNAQYERCDLVSYICGQHPKQNKVWLPTDKPHENYKAQRRLEAVETHLYDVETLIHEVYSSEQPTDNVMQPDQTQEDEAMAQPSRETLDLAGKLRESLAGTTIPKTLAKLYSQHTRLGASQPGLFNWEETETTNCLDDALRLLEAAFAEREGGNDNWHESVRRAGEILEWLSHPQLNVDGLPTRFLAAAAYQLAGYPARSSGLLNTDSAEENESNILKFLLKAEFPNLLSELSKYWVGTVSPRRNELSLSWQNPEELNTGLQQRILKETVGALGILCATMRWGEEPRLETAIAKLKSVGNVMLHGDDPYSWLLAKLCVEIAVIYTRTSMRYNLTSLTEKMEGPGSIALERYLRQSYRTNRALAWPSQVKGIEKLVSESSFVLCTPTGSGKTTIAELAILQSLFSGSTDDQNLLMQSNSASLAIYIVPSRALAAEVEAKLSRVLRNLNDPPINVTGLYGGTDWGPTDVWLTAGNQTVLICTHEKAEALIRFLGPWFLDRVSLVVIDEAHSIQFDGPRTKLQQADSRPLRLEALSSRLFTYLDKSRGRVIALSAVAMGIENSLAGWATGQKDATPAKTSYRSVRQLIGSLACLPDHRFEIRYDLLDGASLKYREEAGKREEQPYIPDPFLPLPNVEGYKTGVETRLRPYLFWAAVHFASQDEGGRQHTVLISLTQNINGFAGDLLELLDKTWLNSKLPIFFQPPQEEEKMRLWEKCLRSCEDYFGRDSKEYKLLRKGIVVHHGRMPGLLAKLFVDLVQEQIVHLVLATSTLSEGVNLPFETILIPSIRRGTQVIPVSEFGNLVGRAGRPGYGTEGRSLVVLDGRNSYPAQQYRREYEGLVAKLKAQGQAQSGVAQARSPLAELLLHLEEMWHRIPGVGDTGDFLEWLEQTEPLKAKNNLDEDDASAAIETLDTLDSLLLSGIVETEQLAHEEVSADMLEERLRQIWQRSYAHYAAQEESRLQEIFVRRGRVLKTKVYPTAYQRRRLYRTGLPPRSGNQLLELYPSFKQELEKGSNYALWNESDRLDYIQSLVEQLTSLPKYKRSDKADRSKVNWREVLQWWLNPTSVTKEPPKDVSAWYKYVSDNFGFRFNWGLGSVIALAADEALNGELLEPSLDNWPLLGLPWIVLWLKELIIWGTLEPVAAYLLSKNLEITREAAEKEAQSYYEEQPPQQVVDELLNASTIRDWATKHYNQEQNSPYSRPPERMQVNLHQDFSKVEAKEWRVIPVEMDSTLQWFDSTGILLATCGRPSSWSDSFLSDYDFMLDVSEKMVSSEAYKTFR
ncbi:MAG: DEAD/DEAH box helicase, partial [Ktedonobacteraceae bacterium]